MKTIYLFTLTIFVVMVTSCNQETKTKTDNTTSIEEPTMNILSATEESEGWQLLFDGETLDGWRNFNQEVISGWEVSEESLVGLGLGGDIGGDIVSVNKYENFILKWDWKLGPKGNSGVMYHVVEGKKYNAPYETGPEYQLIEDDDYEIELEDWQKTAADYAMYLPNDNKKVNTGDWNNSMIIFSQDKAEYWLNGLMVLEFVPWSEDWNERRNSGKWDAFPDYGLFKKGHICLQDHGSKVWFRNIKIKEL